MVYSLTPAQADVARAIAMVAAESPGGLARQAHVAEFLAMTGSELIRYVERLEQRGWARREKIGNAVYLSLIHEPPPDPAYEVTEAGKAYLETTDADFVRRSSDRSEGG